MAVLEGTTKGKVSQKYSKWYQAADGGEFCLQMQKKLLLHK